ncbi:hypothetical protein ACFYXH_13185 [Streptomyces sp. NPDC002730]|uniref:hypothetical protein n=1 Tax=Streptomyces sp. NPDC002730 TaxID=3364662 RepID=UPI0036BE755E
MINSEGARLGAEAARRLAEADCCEIEPGLSDDEFHRIETTYGFRFADDHRAFLAAGLPVSQPPDEAATWEKPWPDWRSGDEDDLRYRLAWPTDGVLRSVEHGYWHPAWGTRPSALEDARAEARNHLALVPQLVPVYAHRFLPAGQGTFGRPVLSMWGTDIIYYGVDLADYMSHEFVEEEDEDEHEDAPANPPASVKFWEHFIQ